MPPKRKRGHLTDFGLDDLIVLDNVRYRVLAWHGLLPTQPEPKGVELTAEVWEQILDEMAASAKPSRF